jgi:RyR domain
MPRFAGGRITQLAKERTDGGRGSRGETNMTFVDDKVREHFPSFEYGPHVRAAAELLALECFNAGKRAVVPDVEEVSAQAHEAWMESKKAKGVTSRKSETGEELMVPYSQLSEAAKDLDRGSVKAVLDAMLSLGVR